MRVRTIRETQHGNPGERRMLPVGALCVVVPADNVPPSDPPRFWASPLIRGKAGGWPDATADWSDGPGVMLERGDFEPVGPAPVEDYVLEHVRASGPVSFGSVKAWLLDQHPEVNAGNVSALAAIALTKLVESGKVEAEPSGDSVVYWPKGD
jgi:hypothetical protein